MHKTKNTWRIDGDTLVLLNRSDGVEIYCPAASAPYVLQHTWCINHARNGKAIGVQTTILDPCGGRNAYGKAKQTKLYLHTLILENAPEKVRQLDQIEIDHEDGNPLNNRLDNLRYATQSVNQHNRRDAEGKPMRGVYRDPRCRTRPWHVLIKADDKRVSEYFSTAREAEEHYLKLKRQYHPDTPEVWFEQYAACQASGYWDAPAPTNSSAPAPATLFESMESR
jgi:hypothetical protein